MANAKDFIGKVKRVKIEQFYVDIPKGLSETDEAAMIEELRDRINNDEDLQARAKQAQERRERFEKRQAQLRTIYLDTELAKRNQLNGGDNPAQ